MTTLSLVTSSILTRADFGSFIFTLGIRLDITERTKVKIKM